MPSFAPTLLLAMPQLDGSWFERAVILLLEHDDQGSFGLVLNRGGPEGSVDEVLELLRVERSAVSPGLLIGGPCSPETALVLHNQPKLAPTSNSPVEGLWVARDLDELHRICAEGTDAFWLVLGYAGWSGGQLEDEMEEGSWFIVPPEGQGERLMRAPRHKLWRYLAGSIGLEPDALPRTAAETMVH